MLTLLAVGALIAFGLWAHNVGIPRVVKKLEEVAKRGEAAAEMLVAEVRAQTKQLKPTPAPGPIAPPSITPPPAPVPQPATAPPAAK